jgi:hypothetical protein
MSRGLMRSTNALEDRQERHERNVLHARQVGNTHCRQASPPHDRRRTVSLGSLDQYGLYLASAGAPFRDFEAAVRGDETG